MNHKRNKVHVGLAFALTSGVFWGLDGVLLGVVLHFPSLHNSSVPFYVTPLVCACFHDSFSFLWLLIYNLLRPGGKEFRQNLFQSIFTKPALIICGTAFIGGPLAMSGYLLGIYWAGSAYAMAISAIYPALGALFAKLFLKEKITGQAWIGIILCILGALIIGYVPPGGKEYPYFYWGITAALVPAIGWALEGTAATWAMKQLDAGVAINIRQGFSGIIYLLLILPILGGIPLCLRILPSVTTFWLAGIAFVGALSYLCWYRAMSLAGAGRAMALNITSSLWAIFFGVFLSHLHLTIELLIGAGLIVLGAFLVVVHPREPLNLNLFLKMKFYNKG